MRVATNPTRIAGSAETKETRPDAKEALSKSAAEHAGVRPTAQLPLKRYNDNWQGMIDNRRTVT